jgi:preprotein translocase subunit SecD
MKTITLLFSCLVTFVAIAAEPIKPATFELRLVLDSASPDSEQLTCTQQRTQGHPVDEKLNVQKKTLIDNSALKSATFQRDPITGAPQVEFTLTKDGTKRFAEVTHDHLGQRLAIVVDGKVCSAPRLQSEIAGGKAVISGSFSEHEATELAARLSAGAKK